MRGLAVVALSLVAVSAAASAGPLEPATVSPDGSTRFSWRNPQHSSSIADDGLPLVARRAGHERTLIPAMLPERDFLSWCGATLVAVAGADRYTTHRKRLVLVPAPYARARPLTSATRLSWVSPACSPDGRVVVASAGRSFLEPRFGLEHRALWSVPLAGGRATQLTHPPAGRTDEAPCFSGDSTTVYFVRSGPTDARAMARGWLYALRLAGRVLTRVGALAPVANFYGHYAWPDPVTPRCGG